MTLVKFAKKVGKKIVKSVRKRYYSKKTGLKYGQMAKDIMMLKSVINPEKRRVAINFTSLIAQVNLNTAGFCVTDITPYPSTGVTVGARIGASIKLHSSFMRFQLIQQTNCKQKVRVRWMIVRPDTTVLTANLVAFVNQIYLTNPFTSIVDYNSSTNPDYFKTYKIIRKGSTIIQDSYYAAANTNCKEFSVPTKYNKGQGTHIRYNADLTGQANLIEGQLIFIAFADTGNSGGVQTTVSPVAVGAPNTGLSINANIEHYYYDN